VISVPPDDKRDIRRRHASSEPASIATMRCYSPMLRTSTD
jgi:hypothetical protein